MRFRIFCFMGAFFQGFSGEALSSQKGCDPQIYQALQESALRGIERSTASVHKAYTRPSSTFDLSCLGDFMDGFKGVNFLFDPSRLLGGFLNTLRNQVCDHAERIWQEKRRKFTGLTPDLIFQKEVPGLEIRSSSLEKGPVTGKIETFSPDVDVILPQVGGKSLPSSSLRGLF